MTINSQEIIKLADLAKLDLAHTNHEFTTQLGNELNNIIKLVENLNEFNLDHIQPLLHIDDQATQPLRQDVITETNSRELFQSIAPPQSIASGLYLVPKVIED